MPCVQCAGKTAEGKRCKNKVSCDKMCTKYCWMHSKGYQDGQNEVCTFPADRRMSKRASKPKLKPKSKSKGRGKK